jgi:hypothetical protein
MTRFLEKGAYQLIEAASVAVARGRSPQAAIAVVSSRHEFCRDCLNLSQAEVSPGLVRAVASASV